MVHLSVCLTAFIPDTHVDKCMKMCHSSPSQRKMKRLEASRSGSPSHHQGQERKIFLEITQRSTIFQRKESANTLGYQLNR